MNLANHLNSVSKGKAVTPLKTRPAMKIQSQTRMRAVGLIGNSREGKMVRLAGLEPARIAPLPPQSSVSANSTITAQCALPIHQSLSASNVFFCAATNGARGICIFGGGG